MVKNTPGIRIIVALLMLLVVGGFASALDDTSTSPSNEYTSEIQAVSALKGLVAGLGVEHVSGTFPGTLESDLELLGEHFSLAFVDVTQKEFSAAEEKAGILKLSKPTDTDIFSGSQEERIGKKNRIDQYPRYNIMIRQAVAINYVLPVYVKSKKFPPLTITVADAVSANTKVKDHLQNIIDEFKREKKAIEDEAHRKFMDDVQKLVFGIKEFGSQKKDGDSYRLDLVLGDKDYSLQYIDVTPLSGKKVDQKPNGILDDADLLSIKGDGITLFGSVKAVELLLAFDEAKKRHVSLLAAYFPYYGDTVYKKRGSETGIVRQHFMFSMNKATPIFLEKGQQIKQKTIGRLLDRSDEKPGNSDPVVISDKSVTIVSSGEVAWEVERTDTSFIFRGVDNYEVFHNANPLFVVVEGSQIKYFHSGELRTAPLFEDLPNPTFAAVSSFAIGMFTPLRLLLVALAVVLILVFRRSRKYTKYKGKHSDEYVAGLITEMRDVMKTYRRLIDLKQRVGSKYTFLDAVDDRPSSYLLRFYAENSLLLIGGIVTKGVHKAASTVTKRVNKTTRFMQSNFKKRDSGDKTSKKFSKIFPDDIGLEQRDELLPQHEYCLTGESGRMMSAPLSFDDISVRYDSLEKMNHVLKTHVENILAELKFARVKEVKSRRIYGAQHDHLEHFFKKYEKVIPHSRKFRSALTKTLPVRVIPPTPTLATPNTFVVFEKNFHALDQQTLQTLDVIRRTAGIFIEFLHLLMRLEHLRVKEWKLSTRKKLSRDQVNEVSHCCEREAPQLFADLEGIYQQISDSIHDYEEAASSETDARIVYEEMVDKYSDESKTIAHVTHPDKYLGDVTVFANFGELMVTIEEELLTSIDGWEWDGDVGVLNALLSDMSCYLEIIGKLALSNPAYLVKCWNGGFKFGSHHAATFSGDPPLTFGIGIGKLIETLTERYDVIFTDNLKMNWGPFTHDGSKCNELIFFRYEDFDDLIFNTVHDPVGTQKYLHTLQMGADGLFIRLLSHLWEKKLRLLCDQNDIEENMMIGKKAVASAFTFVIDDDGRKEFVNYIHQEIQKDLKKRMIDGKKHSWY